MFKKFLCTLFFYVFVISFCYAFIDSDLNSLEQIKYGNVYSDEDYGSRLRRLELDLLGMVQTGDIESRLDILKRISDDSYNAISYNNFDFEPVQNKNNKFKDFFNNITSSKFDSGYITGYTPDILSSFEEDFFSNSNNSTYCSYDNGTSFNTFNNASNQLLNRINNQLRREYRNNSTINPYNERKSNRYKSRFNHRNRNNYHRKSRYNYPYYNSSIPNNTAQNISTRSFVKILKD